MRDLIAAAQDAVVMITCPDINSKGSGFFVSDKGHVLTNNHVIAHLGLTAGALTMTPASQIAVRAAGIDHTANLLTDPGSPRCIAYDYAILQIDPPIGTSATPRGALTDVAAGDPVICLGYPLDFTQLVATKGMVAGLIRRPSHMNSLHQLDSILTDALIQFGNSGGPMLHVDTRRVIGLNTLGHSYPEAQTLEQWRQSAAAQAVPGMPAVMDYVLRYSQVGLNYAISIHHAEADPAFPN